MRVLAIGATGQYGGLVFPHLRHRGSGRVGWCTIGPSGRKPNGPVRTKQSSATYVIRLR